MDLIFICFCKEELNFVPLKLFLFEPMGSSTGTLKICAQDSERMKMYGGSYT